MLAQLLIIASAAVVLLLGTGHVVLTLCTNKFGVRDSAVEEQLKHCSPIISSQTTMWRAWIGFNISHSMGAILFGLIYGYLAIVQRALLFGSTFLTTLGFITLAVYVYLARRYWFVRPLRGLTLALLLYCAGLVAAWF